MEIRSIDRDIRTLLSSGYYKIPRFQRPYSWDGENIQEFWDDVIKDNPHEYFIGSTVVYDDGPQRFGVVDGQQRLTTITILLCVLRDKLAELGLDDLAKGIHNLIERANIDNKMEYVVTTESSYPFFQNHIQKWGEPQIETEIFKEEENLKNAYEKLQELVSQVVNSIRSDSSLTPKKQMLAIQRKLTSFRDSVLDLKVIFVTLTDEDDAYLIFETLNTRGKDLSLTDLVKNHLTRHVKAKNVASDHIRIKWKQLLEIIESSSADIKADTFLHHYWLSKYEYLPAKKLFKELKKTISKDKANSFLNELVSDAALYRAAYETGYGKWSNEEKRLQEALDALDIFGVQQQTPCVLSLLREYRTSKKIKKRHIEDALVAIEKFHFLFTAVTSQRSSGGISGMYAALARRLFNAKDTQEAVKVIKDLMAKLRERVPSLLEFQALIPDLYFTDAYTKRKKLVKYALNHFHQETNMATVVDYKQMTIEHIVPQSQIGTGDYTDEIVGQLGNLILIPDVLNVELKNLPFAQKKPILLANNVVLEPELKAASNWTSDDIVKRTARMAERAYNKIWAI